jgi:hypothetical protein
MKNFLSWLATSPLASFAKIFAAGVLGWFVVNLDSLSVHPAVAIGLVSALPVIINWLNPSDTRYGNEGTVD